MKQSAHFPPGGEIQTAPIIGAVWVTLVVVVVRFRIALAAALLLSDWDAIQVPVARRGLVDENFF